MPDPEVTYDPIRRIPEEWRRQYRSRPPELLAEDVIKLFDAQFKQDKNLQRDKDLVNSKLLAAQRRLGWQAIWAKILGVAVVAQWAVILILFKALLEHH